MTNSAESRTAQRSNRTRAHGGRSICVIIIFFFKKFNGRDVAAQTAAAAAESTQCVRDSSGGGGRIGNVSRYVFCRRRRRRALRSGLTVWRRGRWLERVVVPSPHTDRMSSSVMSSRFTVAVAVVGPVQRRTKSFALLRSRRFDNPVADRLIAAATRYI